MTNTVPKLVDELNKQNEDYGVFYISHDSGVLPSLVYATYGTSWDVVIFDWFNKQILMTKDITRMSWSDIYVISKYVMDSEPNDWFGSEDLQDD